MRVRAVIAHHGILANVPAKPVPRAAIVLKDSTRSLLADELAAGVAAIVREQPSEAQLAEWLGRPGRTTTTRSPVKPLSLAKKPAVRTTRQVHYSASVEGVGVSLDFTVGNRVSCDLYALEGKPSLELLVRLGRIGVNCSRLGAAAKALIDTTAPSRDAFVTLFGDERYRLGSRGQESTWLALTFAADGAFVSCEVERKFWAWQ